MVTIIRNFFHYIKCLMTGEEYISPEMKFIYTLQFLTLVHFALTIFFLGFVSFPLVIYNIFSAIFYQWMISFCKKKYFMISFSASICEVLLFILISTFTLGNGYGFSFYCFAIIPSVFYTCFTIKQIRGGSLFPLLLSILSLLVFLFCYSYDYIGPIPEYSIQGTWGIVLTTANITISFSMIIIFSLLFIWEMKNSYAILEKRNSQLTMFANCDPLTKLPNRRSMMERLNVAMHNLAINGSEFCIILGDIDDFKKVNDVYGHDAGDKVLVSIAHLLTSQMRESDYICRWGGEEILIVISGTTDKATMIAERIRASVQEMEVTHATGVLHVTMTFGVAPAIAGYRVEQIIKQADTKLYYGKEHGKNQVVL